MALGDLKQADEYFDRFSKLPPEIFSALAIRWWSPVCYGVYFAARAKWEESNQAFAKILEFMKTFTWHQLEKLVDQNYAWALERQGRFEEARNWRDRIQALLGVIEHEYAHADARLSVLMPRKVHIGEEFEMRLDLVNVARAAVTLAKIGGVTPLEFNVAYLPSFCGLQDGKIAMIEKSIGPFQVEIVKLKIKVDKAGSYVLNPEISYLDDEGKTKTFKTSPITVTCQPVKLAYEALPEE